MQQATPATGIIEASCSMIADADFFEVQLLSAVVVSGERHSPAPLVVCLKGD
jgi:hypothetical protein